MEQQVQNKDAVRSRTVRGEEQRKNYMFAGSHEVAQNAAMIYSLLATYKFL